MAALSGQLHLMRPLSQQAPVLASAELRRLALRSPRPAIAPPIIRVTDPPCRPAQLMGRFRIWRMAPCCIFRGQVTCPRCCQTGIRRRRVSRLRTGPTGSLTDLGFWHSGQQFAGVGVAGRCKKLIGRALLNHTAIVHHGDVVRNMPDHRQVVANEEIRQP